MFDIEAERAYPTPLANSSLLPLLLLSLASQKHAPTTDSKFKEEYDYIIVGSGSAGSVVASRLSEIPCVSVLLLEAGKSPPLLTEVPAYDRYFKATDIDWNYQTVPQKYTGFGLVNNQLQWSCGKAIGGSSIINEMIYVRGNHKNYDDWARNGAVGWSYSDVRPYFLKLEDNRDPAYLANGYHAVDGPISVETPRSTQELESEVLEAAQEIGYRLVDPNGRRQTGLYVTQTNTRNGQRCSVAKGYLVPAENRTNLDIVPNAFVKRVLFENKRASGVEFDFEGEAYQVRAKREVILSAGNTNTAQLLMLSGIGPTEHLEDLKIPVIADLPVGNNMQDHIGCSLLFELDPSMSSIQNTSISESVNEYISNRTGPLLEVTSLTSFVSVDPDAPPDFPNFQMNFQELGTLGVKAAFGLKPEVYDKMYAPHENKRTFICFAELLQPKSRGTIRLQSASPYDPPIIDPNYFEDSRDIQDMVQGLKECLKIGNSPLMQKLGSKLLPTRPPDCGDDIAEASDAYFECIARSVILTLRHQVGSAKMGDPMDSSTVVDSNLRVKGVEGLRVIDASVMPIIPSGNTNIPTIMVAEKASDILKSTVQCYSQTPVESQNESPSSPFYNKPPESSNVIS